MNIKFAGHEFLLHPSGVLYWPSERLLIVSDLHLEKGSHFAVKGFFLPPYDSHDTLSRLKEVCLELGNHRILLLGDSFHDATGYARMSDNERVLFDELLAFDPIWILGNHDKKFVPDGFYGTETYTHSGITFTHEAHHDENYEISGHFHPKIDIREKGIKLSRPCFVEDGLKMILPSFGAYTGGLSIDSPAISSIFKNPQKAYALGKSKVYCL